MILDELNKMPLLQNDHRGEVYVLEGTHVDYQQLTRSKQVVVNVDTDLMFMPEGIRMRLRQNGHLLQCACNACCQGEVARPAI